MIAQWTAREHEIAIRASIGASRGRIGAATSQILETLQDIPGVSGAAASTTSVPPFMGGPHTRVAADAAGSAAVGAHRHVVSAGFFSTVGVSVRAGRAFSHADLASTRIAIVNETLARQLFPARDPLGRQVWVGDAWYGSPASSPTMRAVLSSIRQRIPGCSCCCPATRRR